MKIICSVVVYLSLAVGVEARAQAIAARITTPVAIVGRADFRGQVPTTEIESILDFAIATLETNRPTVRGRYVSSCRLWADAILAGYGPSGDTVSLRAEQNFERACLPFLWLQRSHPSRVSFLPAPDRWLSEVRPMEVGLLADWPWPDETRTTTSDDREAPFRREPSSEPMQFGATRTDLDGDSTDIPGGYGQQEKWWEAARGDFDGDGVEDALILYSENGIGNSGVGSSAVIVTRKSRHGPIEVVSQDAVSLSLSH